MSQRADRISALLRESIQNVLSRGLSDPRIRGLVTVVGVTVADDLSRATVLISVMPFEHGELTMHGLKAASAHIRRQVGNATAIRRVPELVFKLDTSSARQAKVLDALARVAREREESEADAANNTDGDSSPTGQEPGWGLPGEASRDGR